MALINWYPGHIAKAQNRLKEQLKLIDFVLELVDARLPSGSRFDVTRQLLGSKPRVVVFTKSDMAEQLATQAWLRHYRNEGIAVASLNARTGDGLATLNKAMAVEAERVRVKMVGRGRLPRASRVMVVGLPNVGKSSLINRLAKARRVNVGDKPGVTRQSSWIRLGSTLELMDTPGIIPPKLDDQELALRLAMIGSVSTEAYDPTLLVPEALRILGEEAPTLLAPYRDSSLEAIAIQRGALGPGGTPDIERAARQFMHDLRTGALGRLTLDRPPRPTVPMNTLEFEELEPEEELTSEDFSKLTEEAPEEYEA